MCVCTKNHTCTNGAMSQGCPRPRSVVHGLPGRTACVCVYVCVCVVTHGNQTDGCHVFCWLGTTYC